MGSKGEEISHEYKYETYNQYKQLVCKICGNCNRYFLTPKATIAYCDRMVDKKIHVKILVVKNNKKEKWQGILY